MSIATLEDIIRVKEAQLKILPSLKNIADLKKAEAELMKFLHIEEEFWKKKAGMRWFIQGDQNTKCFHSYVKREKKMMQITEIRSEQGLLLTDKVDIGLEAVKVFEAQFKESNFINNSSILDLIPPLLTPEGNEKMGAFPSEEEIKEAIFQLNGTSAAGLNGFTSLFFQYC